MSKINNEATNSAETGARSSGIKLSKKSIFILAFSWILAIVFLVLGIVDLAGSDETGSDGSSSSKNSSTDDSSSENTSSLTLNLNSSLTLTVGKNEAYGYLYYTPSSSRTYQLSLDGGTLKRVTNENGDDKNFTKYSAYYSIYLTRGVKYTFTVEAEETSILVILV